MPGGKLNGAVEHAHRHAHPHGDAHDAHAHGAGHPARTRRGSGQRRLLLVMLFAVGVLVAEVVGGFVANSLALYSDAAHMSTDVAALALAYAAIRIAARPPSSSKTFGYHRAEVVAAFVNSLALWVVSAYLVYEAVQRLARPQAVDGPIVIAVGLGSLAANLVMALALRSHAHAHAHDLNMRSAYLHVVSDALGSVAAVVAGVGVAYYDAMWLDPATTLFITLLIVVWTWRLTRDTLHVLLEGTPASVKPEELRAVIEGVPGVRAVHDLHVWSLTTGVDSLSAHVLVDDPAEGPAVVRAIRERLRGACDIGHVTIEVEAEDADCVGCN